MPLKLGKPTKQVDTLSAVAECLREEEGIGADFSHSWTLHDGRGFVIAYPLSRITVSGEDFEVPIKYTFIVYLSHKAGHIAVAPRMDLEQDFQTAILFELADPECWGKIRDHIL